MEYISALGFIKQNGNTTYTLTWKNGVTSQHRLFVSAQNAICEFRKRSRKYGYHFCGIENVEYIEVKKPACTPCQRFRKNVNNVIKYLSASGLWTPMLETAKVFLTLTDEELLTAKENWGSYDQLMQGKLKDYHWFGCDCFFNLFEDRAIKTVNYDRWSRETDRSFVANAITTKTNYQTRWRKGYDNSLEVRFDNGYARGWYSEEYKDCGNGHYYFLLDETHTLFGEND